MDSLATVDLARIRAAAAVGAGVVRETSVQLAVETRDRDHAHAVLDALRAAGYEVTTPR